MSWLHANGERGEYPASFYASRARPLARLAPLREDTEADLCVVGAGLTGLSAALHAAQAGRRVVVLEAHRVGWGASGRNGGQIGWGLNWDQPRLERRLGHAAARRVWDLCAEAGDLTRALIAAHAPEAGYTPGLVHADLTAAEFAEAGDMAAYLRDHYGAVNAVLDRGALADLIGSEAYAGGVLHEDGGFCNPLAYVLGLARACVAAGVTIHEGSEVHAVGPHRVRTGAATVRAGAVLHATNGYSAHAVGRLARRALPINNYIAATEPLGDAAPMRRPLAVADGRFVVNYFHQTVDGTLVYGGGESYGRRFPRDIEGRVRSNLARVYPSLRDAPLPFHWGGTLAVTATRLPYLAEISPGLFAAGGYSGHGLALSALFGKLVAEALEGERERFRAMAALPVPALPGGRWIGGLAATAGLAAAALGDRIRQR
ncbi:FAD-binding oxidoreductase [Jannaschia sp. W003]|uniref:NAD(P)/FAD-dependent oxidoreductase n=1 Tax=Jannaschia sp. W003 TaxID=2867012 RepID=UPI0021A39FFB|nr:FAD-binding oxidoreductase [Jannaschia sp. W003]UWQ22754.1 FAD-binding oxidoreductase [Jannaschia sp. W003]